LSNTVSRISSGAAAAIASSTVAMETAGVLISMLGTALQS
jgi:hypothetical protein